MLTSVVFLITNLLYANAMAGAVTAGVAGLIAWLWYRQPLVMRLRGRADDGRSQPDQRAASQDHGHHRVS